MLAISTHIKLSKIVDTMSSPITSIALLNLKMGRLRLHSKSFKQRGRKARNWPVNRCIHFSRLDRYENWLTQYWMRFWGKLWVWPHDDTAWHVSNLVLHNVAPSVAGVSDRRIPIIRWSQLLVREKFLKQSQHIRPTCFAWYVFSWKHCAGICDWNASVSGGGGGGGGSGGSWRGTAYE